VVMVCRMAQVSGTGEGHYTRRSGPSRSTSRGGSFSLLPRAFGTLS